MKIAVLSDIHSNKFALQGAIDLLADIKPDYCFFLGDYFGYYPWAMDTYELLLSMGENSIFVIGNHDQSLIESETPKIIPEYWDVIIQNKQQLPSESINWLKNMEKKKTIHLDHIHFTLCHGTPADTLNGRYYPDNNEEHSWFPGQGEVLLLGHTHYKLLRTVEKGGLILNPGSVGQPRQRGVKPGFAILDTKTSSAEFVEIIYDVRNVIAELENMNWYPRAIDVLKRQLTSE